MNDVQLADYAAVRHILTSPSIAARTARHIRDDDFDWHGLLSGAEAMSTGEDVLVRVAYDLWHASGVVGVWELARRLDGRSFERVVDALTICRGELEPGRVVLHAA
jgi:hypothetical protein